MRIAVIGGCRCGKTTLTDTIAKNLRGAGLIPEIVHGDALAPLGWSEASEQASHQFDKAGPWVFEGVLGARAIRKWLARHRDDMAKPCDAIAVSHEPKVVSLKPGQAAMIKGCATVWAEIEPELVRRGVEIQQF